MPRRPGLTERYFYESFTDRDEFVRAVYDDVCTRAMSALTIATTPRDAVERFVALMVDDPVRGRVLLLAPEAEPVLTRSGAEWMPSFIDLLQRKLTRITDPAIQTMVATGLIGGLTALFTAYLDGRLAATREQFIDYCVDMLLTSRVTTPLSDYSAGATDRLSVSAASRLALRPPAPRPPVLRRPPPAAALAARPSGLADRVHRAWSAVATARCSSSRTCTLSDPWLPSMSRVEKLAVCDRSTMHSSSGSLSPLASRRPVRPASLGGRRCIRIGLAGVVVRGAQRRCRTVPSTSAAAATTPVPRTMSFLQYRPPSMVFLV